MHIFCEFWKAQAGLNPAGKTRRHPLHVRALGSGPLRYDLTFAIDSLERFHFLTDSSEDLRFLRFLFDSSENLRFLCDSSEDLHFLRALLVPPLRVLPSHVDLRLFQAFNMPERNRVDQDSGDPHASSAGADQCLCRFSARRDKAWRIDTEDEDLDEDRARVGAESMKQCGASSSEAASSLAYPLSAVS